MVSMFMLSQTNVIPKPSQNTSGGISEDLLLLLPGLINMMVLISMCIHQCSRKDCRWIIGIILRVKFMVKYHSRIMESAVLRRFFACFQWRILATTNMFLNFTRLKNDCDCNEDTNVYFPIQKWFELLVEKRKIRINASLLWKNMKPSLDILLEKSIKIAKQYYESIKLKDTSFVEWMLDSGYRELPDERKYRWNWWSCGQDKLSRSEDPYHFHSTGLHKHAGKNVQRYESPYQGIFSKVRLLVESTAYP